MEPITDQPPLPPLHAQESARLLLLRELAIMDTAPEPEFDAVTRLLQQALQVPISLVSLIDEQRQWFKSRQGTSTEETPRKLSFCAHTVAQEGPLLVPDARCDERFAANPVVTDAPGVVFYAGMPLIVDGLPVGTVCVIDTQTRPDGAAILGVLGSAAQLLSRLLSVRLHAQRARRGEVLAQEVVQLNSDWAWETDTDGRLSWLDDRHAAATGVAPRSLLGQSLLAIGGAWQLGLDSLSAIEDAMRCTVAFRQLPLNWPTSTGSATLLLSGAPRRDGAGSVVGYRGTAFDPRRGLRAVERAERAEKLLAAAAERFDGAMMVCDAQGQLVLANACWRSLFAPHLSAQRSWPEVLHSAVMAGEFPQAVGCEHIFLASRLDTANPARTPMEMLREGRWWLTQEHRLADGTLLQVALDVTTTKTSEARWRYHAELHQAVARVASDGIVVVNQYGDVIGFNPASARLWQRSDAEMMGMNIFAAAVERIDDRGRPLPLEAHPVRQALRQQTVIEGFRYGLDRPQSPIQWYDLDVIPLGNASEVVMVFRDVSEQRAAVAARSVDSRAVGNLAPMLVGQVNQGAWQWHRRRGRLHLSLSAWAMLGLRESTLNGSLEILSDLIHRDDRQAIQQTLLEQLHSSTDVIDLACRLRHRDGHFCSVVVRGRIHRDDQGWAIEATGMMSDITDQRTALDALAQQQSAESDSAAKSAFLSRVSHEIRTPLNAIVGFSRLLQRGQLPAPMLEPVARIQEAGQHLLGLVNDLLDVQRIETDSLPLSLEPTEVLPLMLALRDLFEVEAAAAGVTLIVDTATLADGWVRADLQRLRQVLINLVGNALKYGSGGTTVTLNACTDGASLRLQVTDGGPGLSEVQQARLFQPFERLGQERSSTPGTGLGLVISRRLATAMGGSLGVRSAPGAGSTFWIELPQLQAEAVRAPAPQWGDDTSWEPCESTLSDARTMLYVEDNPVNVMLLEALVADLPQWRLRVASSGAQALSMLENWVPDLLLLDAHLPDTHGLSLLPEMRARFPALQRVPAVMFTADAMPQDQQASQAAGFEQHWTKPINVDAVLRALRELWRTLAGTAA